MSDLYLKDLLNKKWPLVELGEIASFTTGHEVSHQQINDSNGKGIPCVKAGDINSSKQSIIYKLKSKINPELLQKLTFAEKGDILISNLGDLETTGSSSVYFGEEKIIVGKNLCVLKHQQNSKYLAFAINTKNCQKQKSSKSIFGSVAWLKSSCIKQLKIPLPPIEVQNKIADFLEKFDELERDLEKELKNRQNQLSYYQDYLILKQGYEFFPLSEIITEFISGSEVTHQQINDSNGEGISCVKAGDINSSKTPILYEFKRKVLPNLVQKIVFAEKEDLLISRIGNAWDVGSVISYLGEEKIFVAGGILTLKHKQNSKYLAFALNTKDCKKQKDKFVVKGIKAGNMNLKNIKKLEIPLPNIETQTRIGDFLGKLSELISDIKIGIPAEINLRRKQFEYYREALISS